MKSTNFDYSEDQINSEFQVFMYLEDQKWSHVNLFELNYPHLDRYSDIKPFKHNIIKINARNKYINASPINIGNKKNLFISTQGPKPETIEDFWTMVYDYNSNIIVMLCKVLERGRRKCETYWEAKMKQFEIIILKNERYNMYDLRTIKLINLLNK